MLNDSINRFLGILCYPFTSLDYLHADLLEQYCKANNEKECKNIKNKIKQKVVQYIRQNYSVYSYDEIYLYLEKCYLYKLNINNNEQRRTDIDIFEYYYEVFSNLAKSLISQRNGRLVFKYWENDNDKNLLGGFGGNNKIVLFNCINRHIPLDLIAIVYLLENGVTETEYLNNFWGQIMVSDLQLDTVLSRGVAENHLHSGVSRSFLSMWEDVMKPLNKNSIQNLKRFDLSNNYNYESDELKFYMLSAGILRAFISVVINDDDCEKLIEVGSSSIRKFLQCFVGDKDIREFYISKKQVEDKNSIYGYFISLWDEFFSENNISYNAKENIIFNIFNEDENIKTSGENIFLFNTIKYIKTNYDKCKYIKKMFIQYIRIKNNIFNLLVQQKTIKGLDYFQMQHYSKNSSMNHINNNTFWELAMREQFQDANLKKIEFRRTIDYRFSDFKREVKCFLKSYYDILINDYCVKDGNEYIPYKEFPKVGLVYHLLKQEDATLPNKCYKDGQDDTDKLQFENLKNDYLKLIDNIKELRKEDSELSKYIVGIDAASLENATPVWVFSEVYEKARDSSNEPLITKSNGIEYFQSLGFTFHAGEDFRHILSGIRRIDEVVKHLKFHAGDRIGHGIALGISADEWRIHNPIIVIPRIEALENYIWAYNLLSQNYGDFKTTILAYLEKKIYDLSKEIYGSTEGLTTSVLIDGYLKLFNCSHEDVCKEANEKDFCECRVSNKPIIWNSDKLFIARHCKYYLIKMNEPIHFEITDQDIDIIKELQRIVKVNISKAGIVVEVNPSSNTAIGDMDTLTENHIYNVNNFYYDANNIIVCINSDDPSVFNTNVSNELAYIYYGLLTKNVSKENALNWVERLRINGIDNSFIKREENDEQILRNLKRLMDKL